MPGPSVDHRRASADRRPIAELPYVLNFDATFSPDGSVLYLARYSVLQAISTTAACP